MTATKRAQPTVAGLQAWAEANVRLASSVLAARVYAEAKRERVDAYIKPIFESFAFEYSGPLAGACKMSGPITNPSHLYLCGDEARVQEYFEACDAAHRAHGFRGPKGHCPALRAEHLKRQAERVLLESSVELFGWSVDSMVMHDGTWEKAVELLIGACVATGKVTNLFKDLAAEQDAATL